jgi:hypothetical protein
MTEPLVVIMGASGEGGLGSGHGWNEGLRREGILYELDRAPQLDFIVGSRLRLILGYFSLYQGYSSEKRKIEGKQDLCGPVNFCVTVLCKDDQRLPDA